MLLREKTLTPMQQAPSSALLLSSRLPGARPDPRLLLSPRLLQVPYLRQPLRATAAMCLPPDGIRSQHFAAQGSPCLLDRRLPPHQRRLGPDEFP
eukprot:767936-Hanusia_phi.AAC.5